MGKKTTSRPSKAPTAASPASALTQSGSKSSVLRAAFSPSEYQLALFASVIQGLDAQHIRIHETTTGRLQCEHALGPKETVTSLDWGYYGGASKNRDQSKKKRKRGSDVNGAVDGLDQGDVVVAFGTSTSEIRMYSPAEDKVVGTLSGVHEKGIKDFKFTADRPAQEAWSIGGDNKIVQWDLRSGQSIRTIHLPASSVFTALSRPLPSNPPVICASQTPYLIDVESTDEPPVKFPAMRNQIHTVIPSSSESAGAGAFLASDGERFINVFDASSRKLVRNLVAEQDVSSVSLYTDGHSTPEKQVLAAVTEDGTIELFTKPFVQPQNVQNASAKASRKQMTQKANAYLKITRSDSSDSSVAVVSTSFQGPDLVVAYAEGGVIPMFERIKFLDENTDELSFTGVKTVVKSKSSSALTSVTTNGVKNAGESRVDESRAVVEQGNLADGDVEMEDSRQDAASVSGSEEDSDDDENTKAPSSEKKTKPAKQVATDEDVEMQNASESEEEPEEDGAEPSFGELLRANTGQEVDVEAELDDDVLQGALVPGKPKAAVQQIPSGVSLATVLTQSLKTNDSGMLESCFHTGDTTIIRTTIQRLESSLAAILLQKLAERLSSRPGRYGHLLVWVQWTCVAHGGALAGHPKLLKRIATLYKVMDQRSSSLSSLLLLKGKLDMLDAQLGLRQSIRGGDEDMDSEDEDNVIYVEGQDDDADSEAEAKTSRPKSIRDQAFDEDESMMNGIADESEDDEDDASEEDDDDDDEEPILEIEAAESVGSSDAEESLEENEEDDDDDADSDGSMVDFIADTEDEESDDAAVAEQPRPSKKAKTAAGKKGKVGKK
ncbi:Small-subunit processome Utp12 [Penicillium alfredii]|uniref:Small-subunit processome Utp12 n=1 Tax=Penicillium alfredii TaxID=1506179 RepID=A0A9W9FK77_9EURO|nr:Small-subunit processome Utp12 [Penicillium alfredii]KAJ5101643.1 Small-subunit processome Utp12 [Penicillium alfredii]